jgi:cytochrome c553
MKPTSLKITVLAAILCLSCAWTGHTESLAIQNCTWCHGASAQGYAPAPRLAGQSHKYIENQLISFRNHTRDNPFSRLYMWGAAANLSPEMAHYLATYFSTVPPKAADDGFRELAATGAQIYQDGVPESNIVSCVACHGPNGEGFGEIPRLGGLSYYYLKRRLEQWGEGFDSSAKFPMPRIASSMSQEQIDAVASYLSFVDEGTRSSLTVSRKD